jgi:hypothetical protein
VRGRETRAQQTFRTTETYGQALVRGRETRAQQTETYGQALVRGRETRAQQRSGTAAGSETRA